jgi:hypothetical protein
MAARIDSLYDDEIIRVVHSGNVTLEERVNIVHEVCVDYYKPNAKLKVLIDARLVTQNMTETEQVLFGTFIAEKKELKNACVAVVINPGQIVNQTVVNKSTQLGHHIKLFGNESEALLWLKTE